MVDSLVLSSSCHSIVCDPRKKFYANPISSFSSWETQGPWNMCFDSAILTLPWNLMRSVWVECMCAPHVYKELDM